MKTVLRIRASRDDTLGLKRIKSVSSLTNIFTRNLRNICIFFHILPKLYTVEELNAQLKKVQELCLGSIQTNEDLHSARQQGMKLLKKIMYRTKMDKLNISYANILLWCSIACIYHYQMRLGDSAELCEWKKRKEVVQAFKLYDRLVRAFMPDMSQLVINSILAYFAEAKLWKIDFLCVEIIQRITFEKNASEKCLSSILSIIESRAATDVKGTNRILKTLHGLLQIYEWGSDQSEILERVLYLFRHTLGMPDTEKAYERLRPAVELCLRCILENISNTLLLTALRIMIRWSLDASLCDECILEFGNIIEYTALLHRTELYKDSLTSELFPLIMELVASENCLRSLLGNRIFQHIIDRHANRVQFDTPRLFIENTNFDIIVGSCHKQDRRFLKSNRKLIHETFLTAITRHGIHRINLETTYTSIALIVAEIPCGYTAASIVCLIMSIQQNTIANELISLASSHRLHAMIISIITLICWVHEATVFYGYVNSIIDIRAQQAPYLNPPLKGSYFYAHHHILWNKPELFLEDWEARFGLWKCFRTKKARVLEALV